jgi:hypothetical protein
MSEAEALFAALRQSTGDDEVAMLERMVRDAPDHALNKMNVLDLAAKEGIGEVRVIAVLLNAVGLGAIVFPIDGLESFIGGEHAGTTWANDVPRHLKEPSARSQSRWLEVP